MAEQNEVPVLDPDVRRLTVAVVLLLGSGVLSSALGSIGHVERYAVGEVLDELPVGREVVVVGRVASVVNTTESWAKFVLAEDGERLPVYCTTMNGNVTVSPGERVRVAGRFELYHGGYELSTQCFRVERKG